MSKFNESEIIIGGIFTLLADLVAFLFDLLAPVTAGITMVLGVLLQSVVSFGTSWWLKGKGGSRAWKLERQITKQVSNLLPVVPTAFTAFIIEVVLHNIKINKDDVKKKKVKK